MDLVVGATGPLGGAQFISLLDVAEFVVRTACSDGAATDEYQKTFAGLLIGMCEGDSIDMTGVLKRFPVRLTSVRSYARKMAGKR
jgi:hypothetical protein